MTTFDFAIRERKIFINSLDHNEENIIYTKSGWVDLSGIKMRGKSFDWEGSIGRIVPFKYNDIESHLIITGKASQQNLYVDIPNYTSHYSIAISQLKCGQLGGALKQITSEYKYNIGDIANGVLILNRYRIKNMYKYYDYQCLKDGYIGHIREDHLITGNICPACVNKAVVVGINDIATTHPDMADLLLYPDDKFKYTFSSSKKVYFKCPRCGNIIYTSLNNVSRHGLSCKKCGDGISYPEKVIFNFLSQVCELHKDNILLQNYEIQKTFDWSKNISHQNLKLSGNKRYDFYIPLGTPIIIEAHGLQHYEEWGLHVHKNARSLAEEQENDELKMYIAISNGILSQNYIQLDCRYSNIDYIKCSIMSSNLPELLDFTESDIDWNECNKFATSSRVYEACDLWNDGNHVVKDIANAMKMDRTTIRNYLRRGFELGILRDPPKYLLKT